MVDNLYVHFPFCRRKCSYCALYSRAGVSQADRDAYARRLASEIGSLGVIGSDANANLLDPNQTLIDSKLKTVYFGGGSPALCDLRPILDALVRGGAVSAAQPETEFTVELHPLDVTEDLLKTLRDGGVNRISMGVQSLNDAVLADMGRGYTVAEAERAFALVKRYFDNSGIDLIVGYPGEEKSKSGVEVGQWREKFFALNGWGLKHCSVYSLQNERGLKNVPDDDVVLDRIRHFAKCLEAMGLERYEISNYAVPGYECRHNLAVWRGEDYIGLGDGACGRIGLKRTKFGREETVSAEFDEKERRLFRLRTREGLDASGHPEWESILAKYCGEGLLTQSGAIYRLTDRGTEVCDSILADLA